MSAVSLIVTSDAVHLITDASFYDEAGRLVQIRSKVTHSADHMLAVACTGCTDRNRIAAWLEGSPDQGHAINRARDCVQGIRAENDAMNPGGAGTGHNDLMVFIAAWHKGRPRGWLVSSSQAWLGAEYTPYTMVEVDALSSPPVPLEMFDATDPITSGGAILDVQRASRWEEGDQHSFVGGFGEITTITAKGIAQTRVREWPDQIGQRVIA